MRLPKTAHSLPAFCGHARRQCNLLRLAILALALLATSVNAAPLGTAFTYQGRLTENGVGAFGPMSARFQLFANPAGPPQIGADQFALINPDVGGLFMVELDFGAAVFTGEDRYLEVALDPENDATFQILAPRQHLTPSPNARFAASANSLHASDGNPLHAAIVDAVGNVGIGTTTPEGRLHVHQSSAGAVTAVAGSVIVAESSGTALLSLLTPKVDESGIVFGSTISNIAGGMRYNTAVTPDGLDFRTNGNVTRMVLDSTGRVGIGSSAPDNMLHVMKGSAGLVAGHPNAPLVIENSTNAYINMLTPDVNERGLLFGSPTAGATSGGIIYNAATTPEGLQFRTGGNVNRVVIDASGGVGLGTTAPATDLHVFENSGVSRIRVESADNQAGISFLSDSTVENVIYSPDSTDDLRFFVNSADRLSITSAGDVGIGTTAPDTKLEVRAGQARIKINSTSSPTTGSILELSNRTLGNTTTGAVNFIDAVDFIQGQMEYVDNGLSFSTAGTFQMRLDPAGNLGVGTSTPTAKLHVVAPAGNSSVILPASSVSNAEIADEPGLASDYRDAELILPEPGTTATLCSRTITVPTDGFVIALASANVGPGFIVGTAHPSLSIHKTTAPTASTNGFGFSSVGSLEDVSISFHAVFAVSAGANTFELRGLSFVNESSAFTRRLTLMFVPTTYGTTDVED